MPISVLDFVVAMMVIVGVPLALALACRRNRRLALWCGLGIGVFIVGGNVIEMLATGKSRLF